MEAGLEKVSQDETFRFCASIHRKDFELRPSDFPRLLHLDDDLQKRRNPPEAQRKDAETDPRRRAETNPSVAHAVSISGTEKCTYICADMKRSSSALEGSYNLRLFCEPSIAIFSALSTYLAREQFTPAQLLVQFIV